ERDREPDEHRRPVPRPAPRDPRRGNDEAEAEQGRKPGRREEGHRGERQRNAPRDRYCAEALADQEPDEENEQDDGDAVENISDAGHVVPGDVRERKRARVTLPNGGIVRRARVEEEEERDGRDKGEPVAEGDEAAVERRAEPAGRIGEKQVGGD